MGTAGVFPISPSSSAPLRPPLNAISERGGRMGFARPERRKEGGREGDGGARRNFTRAPGKFGESHPISL